MANGNSHTITFRLPPGILRALDAFCKVHDLTRSQAIKLAIVAELRTAGMWPSSPVKDASVREG